MSFNYLNFTHLLPTHQDKCIREEVIYRGEIGKETVMNVLMWLRLHNYFSVKNGTLENKEITYGVNGWHPHTHDIEFNEREVSLEDFAALSSVY